MKNCILCLLVSVMVSCVSDARGDLFDVSASAESYVKEATTTGNPISFVAADTTGLSVGKVFKGKALGIIPFELPSIPAGHVVTGANLSFSAFRIGNAGGSTHADLYGLDFRTSTDYSANGLLTSYFYASPFQNATDPDATLIQNDILTLLQVNTDFTTGLETNSVADDTLATYLNTQLVGGAVAGDFVFLRFNVDDFDSGQNGHTYIIGSTTATSPNNEVAVLSITTAAVPEPSAFLFGSLVCSVLGLRSARRGRCHQKN